MACNNDPTCPMCGAYLTKPLSIPWQWNYLQAISNTNLMPTTFSIPVRPMEAGDLYAAFPLKKRRPNND